MLRLVSGGSIVYIKEKIILGRVLSFTNIKHSDEIKLLFQKVE